MRASAPNQSPAEASPNDNASSYRPPSTCATRASDIDPTKADPFDNTFPSDYYIILLLDDPGPIKIHLRPTLYTTARHVISEWWCLQRHGIGNLARGVLRNSDASRGAPTVSAPAP